MVVLKIEGINVEFPYEPYEIQVNYMTQVIRALQQKQNALLESPTGTGKTLCLLCASLAWLEYEKFRRRVAGVPIDRKEAANPEDPLGGMALGPRIIYASRTHSQLAQVMQELKKTPYAKINKVAVLGSREQMCIHPVVSQMANMAAKNRTCRQKVRTRSCAFYMKLEETKDSSVASTCLADIEELIDYGKKNRVCPYYLSKASEKSSDIMFLPYNYVFDPSVRQTMKLELEGAVVILDEGHNVGKVCEDSYSYEFTSIDLATCISEVKRILKELVSKSGPAGTLNFGRNNADQDSNAESGDEKVRRIAELQKTLLTFERSFEEITLSDDPNAGIVRPVTFLQDLFHKSRINRATYPEIKATLQELFSDSENTDSPTSISAHNLGTLQKFSDLLDMACSGETAPHHHFFRVYIRKEDCNKRVREGWSGEIVPKKLSRVLSVWCLSPGCTMKTLMASGVHSLIITSGTLSPVQPLLQEFSVPFPVQLFNPHIIKSSQVWVGVVGKGPDGIELTSQYKTRDSLDYRRSLGRTICNMLDVIPEGVLVFFSSYRAMTDCVDTWKKSDIWDSLEKRKKCFVEPTNRNEFNAMLAEYFKLVREDGVGAAFFGVCRGKISEGVDFPDNCARGVMVTGLPYPNKFEAKIRVKMEYLQETFTNPQTRTLSSNDWYNREAWSAVNQAAGRVIRHVNDYGACIFLDCRFDSSQSRQQLSGWLRNQVKGFTMPLAKRALGEFFRHHVSNPKERILPTSVAEKFQSLVNDAPDVLKLDDEPCCENSLPQCSQPAFSFAAEFSKKSVTTGQERDSDPKARMMKRKASVFDAMDSNGSVTSRLPVEDTNPFIDEVSTKPFSVSSSQVSMSSSSASQTWSQPRVVKEKELDDLAASSSSGFIPSTQKRLVIRPRIFEKPNPPPAEKSASGTGKQQQSIMGFLKPAAPKPATQPGSSQSGSSKPKIVSLSDSSDKDWKKEQLAKLRKEVTPDELSLITAALKSMKEKGHKELLNALDGIKDQQRKIRVSMILSKLMSGSLRAVFDKYLCDIGAVIEIS